MTHYQIPASFDRLISFRVARLSIYAALNGEKSNGRLYNITEEKATTFEERWPRICASFGLVGVPPTPEKAQEPLTVVGAHISMLEWANAHADAWKELEKEYNLKPGVLEGAGWDFMDFSLLLPFEHTYDNTSRIEQLGFDEKVDIYGGLEEAWKDFAKFGHIHFTK